MRIYIIKYPHRTIVVDKFTWESELEACRAIGVEFVCNNSGVGKELIVAPTMHEKREELLLD